MLGSLSTSTLQVVLQGAEAAAWSEAKLGAAIGHALKRLGAALEAADSPDGDRLRSLDELIGVVLFARRAGNTELGRAVAQELTATELDTLIADVASRLPSSTLAVIVGAGSMGIGLAKLIGHGIRPGGHSWRDRVVVATPFAEEYDAINGPGRYEPGSKASRNVAGVINFAEGPTIEAVPLDDLAEVLPDARSVLVMVPSAALAAVTPKVAASVPAGVPVVEFTKGMTPAGHELPRVYLASQLGARNPVVTIGGFCPSQKLHEGAPVTLAIASEDQDAAATTREILTGGAAHEGRYVGTVTDPNPSAVELAGTLKNVVALRVGLEATRQARGAAADGEAADPVALIGQLVRRGLADESIELSAPILEDAHHCCSVAPPALQTLVTKAKRARIRSDTDAVQWIERALLPMRTEIAPTRNVIVGVIAGLVEAWDPSGDRLSLDRVLADLDITMEGVASLAPLAGWLEHRGLPLPEALAGVYERFASCLPQAGSSPERSPAPRNRPHQRLLDELVRRGR